MFLSGQLKETAALTPEKNPGTHWIGEWVGPTEQVWDVWRTEKSCTLTWMRTTDHPVCSLIAISPILHWLTEHKNIDWGTGWTLRSLNPIRNNIFSLLQNVPTGPGAHPASYLVSIVVLFRGWSCRGAILVTQIHLKPRLKISTICPYGLYRENF